MRSTESDSRAISVMRLSTGTLVGEIEAADALGLAGDTRERARQQQRGQQRADHGEAHGHCGGQRGALQQDL